MRIQLVVVLILILCIPVIAEAAKIRGAIYDHDFQPIKKSVVKINSTPEQTRVSQFGGYHFIVPPGSYEITAELTLNDITKEIAQEFIIVPQEGDFVKDLILFEDFDLAQEFEDTWWRQVVRFFNENIGVILFASLLILIVVIIAGVIVLARKKRLPQSEMESLGIQDITPYQKETSDKIIKQKIINILRKNAKKAEQKTIRKDFTLSEAKMSLILSEMEQEGTIQKVKEGRKNMILLQ